MRDRVAHWRNAWVGLALALGLHVADEALTGFLPVYNEIVEGVRARHSWVLLPTFTFPVWIGGLAAAVALLLALTPVVSRGARWIRIASLALGVMMAGNAVLHLGASVFWGRLAPGTLSSPVLLAAAIALVVTASRAKTQRW